MRYGRCVLIPVVTISINGCKEKKVDISPPVYSPESIDTDDSLPDLGQTATVTKYRRRGNPNRNRDRAETLLVFQTQMKQNFSRELAAKRAEVANGLSPPTLSTPLDTCTEVESPTLSLRPHRSIPSISDGDDDPWNTVFMYGVSSAELRAVQYFINDAQDPTQHRMIHQYAMMSFLSREIDPHVSLKPTGISRLSRVLLNGVYAHYSRGLVLKPPNASYEASVQFLVSELPGPSIRDLVRAAGRPLSESTCMLLFKLLLSSLQRLHALGIVHGNIHWGSVGLARDGRLVFTDFRYARFKGDMTSISDQVHIYHSIPEIVAIRQSTDGKVPASFMHDIHRACEMYLIMRHGETHVGDLRESSDLMATKRNLFARWPYSIPSPIPRMDSDPQALLATMLSRVTANAVHAQPVFDHLLFNEPKRVTDIVHRYSPVNGGYQMTDTLVLPQISDLGQIEVVVKGSINQEVRFAKYLTSCVGVEGDAKAQQDLHNQARLYNLVRRTPAMLNKVSHLLSIKSPSAVDRRDDTLGFIYRPVWPARPDCSVSALLISGKPDSWFLLDYLATRLDGSDPRSLVVAAAKIAQSSIRLVQQLHATTRIVYNNFFLEKLIVYETSPGEPNVFFYDLSRAFHPQFAVWKPSYSTPREELSASPFELMNETPSIKSDVYQAAQMFLKILAGSEQKFRFIVNAVLQSSSIYEAKLLTDPLPQFFDEFISHSRAKLAPFLGLINGEDCSEDNFRRFIRLISELDVVVAQGDPAQAIEAYCDSLFNKFAEIINFH